MTLYGSPVRTTVSSARGPRQTRPVSRWSPASFMNSASRGLCPRWNTGLVRSVDRAQLNIDSQEGGAGRNQALTSFIAAGALVLFWPLT